LLPKSDADLWLTEGFAAYERLVAFELHLRSERDDGKLTDEDTDRLIVELNRHRSQIRIKSRREIERDTDDWANLGPNSPYRDQFVRSETGRGVLRFDDLRKSIGDARFIDLMDRFGQEHAGKKVGGDEFAAFMRKNRPKDDRTDVFRDPVDLQDWPRHSIQSWLDQQEDTVIVYGTKADIEANRETAMQLQKAIARRGSNIVVPMISDVEANAADKISGKHLLVIGGPSTNKLANDWKIGLPATFATGSFQVRDSIYAHPGSAVVAAKKNPLSPFTSVVVIAGLSAESTQFAIRFLLDNNVRGGNVLVIPNQARARSMVVK
jgi:hypothetical protein